MANVREKAPTTATTTTASELPTEVALRDHVVQQRLSKRGRRLLAHVGPLGWFLFDAAVAMFAVMLAYAVTPKDATIERHISALPFAFGFAFLVGTVSHIAGLHDPRFSSRSQKPYAHVAAVVSIAMSLLLVELSVGPFLKVGRYIILISAFTCGWLMVAARIVAAHFAANYLQTVVFLGDDRFCFRGFQFVDSHKRSFNVKSRHFVSSPASESELSLSDWAVGNDVDELVFDPAALDEGRDRQLLECLDQGIKVSAYSDFVEDHYLLVPVNDIDASWVFSARLDLAHPYYHGVKRCIDVVASLIGILITLPLVLPAILMIKLDGGGSAIYSQTRTGRFGRPFTIYKLRTMIPDAESQGAQWASAGDSRVTRLGRFLRKTRIDEFPQFWNVLKGEMSLVGPRPERPEFVEMLQNQIPFYVQRHLVKPGLTGWAQINYPYGASVADSMNKLTFDLFYVKRASLTLDLGILLRTIGTIMKGSR